MLRLEGVHTYYGTGHILQGVDFEVPQGTITGILGRNGVGKTTTANNFHREYILYPSMQMSLSASKRSC